MVTAQNRSRGGAGLDAPPRGRRARTAGIGAAFGQLGGSGPVFGWLRAPNGPVRSEEHTSELQSRGHLVCRLLLEKKKNKLRALIHYIWYVKKKYRSRNKLL